MKYKNEYGDIIEVKDAKISTGVLDRNKKEIFEDDIILVDTEDFLGKFKVVFSSDIGCSFCGGSLSGFRLEFIEEVDVDDYEFIDDSYFDIIKE